jgi:hypothetical protein
MPAGFFYIEDMARIGKNQLLKLQKKYHTDASIARMYNMSRQAIAQMRKRYGIAPVLHRTKERNNHIVEQYTSGKPVAAIAKKAGLTDVQIYRIIAQHAPDVPRRRPDRLSVKQKSIA